MEDQENQLIYSFPRGKGEEIQISLRKHNDKYYIDLRQWFQSKNENMFLPTKKGVRLAMDSVHELRRGVERLSQAIERLKKKAEPVEY